MNLNLLLLGLFVFAPFGVSAFSGSEVNINKNGDAVISNAVVYQVAGQSFFTRLYWGDAFVRLTVKGDSKTRVLRGTGEVTNYSEIKEGDLLDLTGTLESGANTLSLVATQIKNVSVQKQKLELSGKVKNVDVSSNRFQLDTGTKARGLVYVSVSATTTVIKGSRTIDLSRIKNNDKITKASGDYDYKTNTLSSNNVVVYLDPKLYSPQVYEGVLSSITNTTLPSDIDINVSGNRYKIILPAGVSVINKNKAPTSLSRFEVGDKIRVYGKLREADDLIVDAEVVRNTDL